MNMQERDIVLDVLNGTKASISNYAKAITECGDQNLRQTLQQMRDGDEQFQYDLYKIAEQKNYYVPSPTAGQNDIQQIKSFLSQSQQSGMQATNTTMNMTQQNAMHSANMTMQ